ncbi:MAG: alpha/beta hydrolase, partial [Desulfomonilia bacterium]|nr:alpha/beta hydrolase [Desulfomonilia bacterium]
SGGGWVIHFASQHPDRAKKLVLIDSNGPVHPVSLTFKLFCIPVIGELFSNFFTVDDLRKGLEDAFFDKTLVTEAMIQEIRAPLTFHMNRRAQRLCIRNTDYRVTAREMQAIANPTLVIWGEQDQYLDSRLANVFRETMPDARVVLISNCGHSAHEEKPDTVNRLIITFLNGHPATM